MHAEHLTPHSEPHLQLLPDAEWFTDSGIAPDGKWWIAPTCIFLQHIWHSCVGDDLKKRGFRLGHDGHHIGVSQHTVIYLPLGEL